MSTDIFQAILDVRGFSEVARQSLLSIEAGSITTLTDATAPALAGAPIWLFCSDGCTILVDVLSADDLIERAMADELRQRILTMRAQNDHGYCYILYTSTVERGTHRKCLINGKQTNIAWRAWQGVLNASQEYGAIVLPIESDDELGGMLSWIGQKNRNPGIMRPLKDGTFYTAGEAMLLDIPQLGPARLEKLLKFTRGNVAYALAALTDPTLKDALREIGIPESAQIEARKALSLEDGLYLSPVIIGEREEVL
jgi:hypothetical protein